MRRLLFLIWCRRFRGRTEGMAAVEFAIMGAVLCLFIGGIIDFGHAWYMKQVVTNASREGARYGIAFKNSTSPGSMDRIKPNALSPSISSYVINTYLAKSSVPSSANPTVTVAGTGYTSGVKGDPLEVTVTATKNWWIVASFIPSMSSSTNFSSSTVMQLE
jgi:Flp pilus assembly protein TadG